MNPIQLPKLVTASKKRLGRGYGSGKAKTAGRGTKGQKARGTMPAGFEGGQLPLIKRLPLLRGKGKNGSQKTLVYVLPVTRLESLPAGSEITLATLKKHRLVGTDTGSVKILGSGALTHAYTVKVACSLAAKTAIEKAGGKVEN
jgi:large subunit ribosomal protein L15